MRKAKQWPSKDEITQLKATKRKTELPKNAQSRNISYMQEFETLEDQQSIGAFQLDEIQRIPSYYLNLIPENLEYFYKKTILHLKEITDFFAARNGKDVGSIDWAKLDKYLLPVFFLSVINRHKSVYVNLFLKEKDIQDKIELQRPLESMQESSEFLYELINKAVELEESHILVKMLLHLRFKKEQFKMFIDILEQQAKIKLVSQIAKKLNTPKRYEKRIDLVKMVLNFASEASTIAFYREIKPLLSEDEVFKLIQQTKQNKLVIIYKRFPFVVTEKLFQYLIDQKRYQIMVCFSKTIIFDFIIVKNRFRQVLTDFQRGIESDYILQIIFKAREILSYEENLRLFYRSVLKIFESEPTISPLFLSKNPLNFALMIGVLLKQYNKLQNLKNEDYKRLANKYVHLVENLIKISSDNIVTHWIQTSDGLGKTFLNYCFKIYSEQIISSPQVQRELGSFGQRSFQQKLVLSYYFNTLNFHWKADESRTARRRTFDSQEINRKQFKNFKTKSTHSNFMFGVYARSLMFRILNQIINLVIILSLEIAIIYLFDAIRFGKLYEPGQIIFQALVKHYPEVFYIVCALRVSFFVQTIGQIVIYRGFKEKVGILRLDVLSLLSQVLINLIFFLVPFERVDEPGGFLLIFAKDTFCYLLVIKIISLLLPTPVFGKAIRIFTQLLTQLVRFLLFSAVVFAILALVLQNIFLLYNDEFNYFTDVFRGFMRLYEYTFGSVAYTIQSTTGYAISMNIVLIVVSFFGNFLLFNIMTTVFSADFDKINDRAFYLTSKSQYEFYTVYPRSVFDSIYYIPFNLHVAFLPLIFLLTNKSLARTINSLIKIISHVIFVDILFLVFLILFGTLVLIFVYFRTFGEFFTSDLPIYRRVGFGFIWIFIGAFYLLYVMFFDFRNCVRVICNYTERETDLFSDDQKMKHDDLKPHIEFKNFYKKTKKVNLRLKKELDFDFIKYFYIVFPKKKPVLRKSRKNATTEPILRLNDRDKSQSTFNNTKHMNWLKAPLEELNVILEKFRMADDKINTFFVQKYLKRNKTNDLLNLHFNFAQIENAMFLTIYDEEKDIQTSLQEIDEKIEAIQKTIEPLKQRFTIYS